MNQENRDSVEDVAKNVHVVIPVVGVVLSFMLAFIAITLA